jgi:prevent-host-death family protein
MGLRDIRADIGRRVDAAYFQDEPTIITKNDEPRAVIVSYQWFQAALARQEEQS